MNDTHGKSLSYGSFLSSKSYLLGTLFLAVVLMALFWTTTAQATQTVPYKINFQGRLTDTNGQAMADGLYNMKFRIWTDISAGTNPWGETRETTSRIQVTNGLFSVQLGEVTPLTPSLFTSQPLYFEVELPTPATATCSVASCAVFNGTEVMTPRRPLGASPYAMNADTVDGIDGSNLARVDTANTFSSTTTFSNTLTVNAASTFTGNIAVTGAATLSVNNSISVVDAGNTGSVVLGVNGITLTGAARKAQQVTLSPEYSGATFTGDGTANLGSLSSDFCSSSSLLNVNAGVCGAASDEHNYYAWTTTEATAQDYDLYVRYRIPSDYDTGTLSNLKIWGWGTTAAGEVVSLSLYKGSATPCGTISDAATANAGWTQGTSAAPLGSCSITAGDMVTFKVHVVAGTDSTVRAGEISFDYLGKF